jgi:hypothetical protein
VQFRELNRNIGRFCEAVAEDAGSFKQLPKVASREHTVIGKPAYDFPSSEDYIYFVLLYLVMNTLNERLFSLFHPTLTLDEDRAIQTQYTAIATTGG